MTISSGFLRKDVKCASFTVMRPVYGDNGGTDGEGWRWTDNSSVYSP